MGLGFMRRIKCVAQNNSQIYATHTASPHE